MDECNLTRSI